MSELDNLDYSAFSAGYTSGEHMTIIDADTPHDTIINSIFNSCSLWYYDGAIYHIVVHFEVEDDSVLIYYFDMQGQLVGKRFGGGA